MKQYLEKRGIYITWSQLVTRIILTWWAFACLVACWPDSVSYRCLITSGTHMPTSWICGIIVCVF